jgi:hypothetical protein
MRRKLVVFCEHCGGTELSGTPEFVMFHCLTFCSPDCRDDYRGIDAERRELRRDKAAAKPAKRKRAA